MVKLAGSVEAGELGRIWNTAGLRLGLARLVVLSFLGLNLWYRLWTIFDYSGFVRGLFVFLTISSVIVILFPKRLKSFLFLFGASFFLFGFRGYDIQSQVFETIVVFVCITVFFVTLRRKDHRCINRQLFWLIICYIVLSVLSLQLLPVGHIIMDFRLFGLKTSFLQVANAIPNSWLYPFSGINRLILFFILAWVVSSGNNAQELFKGIFVGIFVGGVFCAFVGLLDYYGIISLEWYRLGITTTPGSLHSTFLNRGWLAEFILVFTPFVLIGFIAKIKGLWWKILLLACLVLCELTLIMAGARGGWLSYPLILFFCWLFFYFSKEGRLETFQIRWWDLAKVAASVPITIIISFLLIFQVIMPITDHLRQKEGGKSPGVISEDKATEMKTRAAGILDSSSRVPAWTQGIDTGKEQPWFGMGYESFGWHTSILSGIPESHYTVNKDNKFSKLLDTPHNIYCQLFVSGGVAGVCLWAAIIGYALMILVVDLIRNKRLLNIPVMLSILSFHIYGIFQSMQYIPMIWMFIFLTLGYALTIDETVLPDRIRRITDMSIKMMICLVLLGGMVYFAGRGSQGLADKYGMGVYAKEQDWHQYHGFYPREKFPQGYYRWSGRRGKVVIRGQEQGFRGQSGNAGGGRINEGSNENNNGNTKKNSGVVEFNIQCHTPQVDKKPLELAVWMDGKRDDMIMFDKKGSVKRWYYVGTKEGMGVHEFLFDVSRTWNPKKMGISADLRNLGVAVSEPMFLDKLPKDGVGFYDWEALDDLSTEGILLMTDGDDQMMAGKKKPVMFRWTMKRALMNVSEMVGRGVNEKVVFLRCAHPDIEKEGVVVKVLGDGEVLSELEFRGYGWRKVDLKDLAGKDVVTVEVSRTWNPKRSGVSEDSRDLGVAVVIPLINATVDNKIILREFNSN